MANPGVMAMFMKVKPDGTEQLEDCANAARRGRPDAKSVHTAMASSMEISDTFVPTDAESQRRLNRPLHQKRTRDKRKPERLVELWMDSGASENLGPLDEVQANTKNQRDPDKEQVLTADANTPPETSVGGTICRLCDRWQKW
jgi:hypothetical protein